MKRYQLQYEHTIVKKGITSIEILAESEEEALSLCKKGKGEVVDYFDDVDTKTAKNHIVLWEEELPKSLLDHIQ